MIDAANQTVISQINPAPEFQRNVISQLLPDAQLGWRRIAAFAARTNGVWSTYLWLPDGSLPIRVGPALNGARPPTWSPEGEQLAFVTPHDHNHSPTNDDRLPRWRVISNAPTDLVLPPTEFHWIGRRVLALRDGIQPWQYYQADTGELLFTWQEALSMGSALDHHYPAVPPDGRWLPSSEDHLNASGILHKTYHLYDLQNRQEILLYEHPWH